MNLNLNLNFSFIFLLYIPFFSIKVEERKSVLSNFKLKEMVWHWFMHWITLTVYLVRFWWCNIILWFYTLAIILWLCSKKDLFNRASRAVILSPSALLYSQFQFKKYFVVTLYLYDKNRSNYSQSNCQAWSCWLSPFINIPLMYVSYLVIIFL